MPSYAAVAGEAKVVASLHGASLTNMPFMGQGGTVSQLRSPGDRHNNCCFALSSAPDHSNFYHLGRKPMGGPTTTDIVTDCEELSRTLSEIEDYITSD